MQVSEVPAATECTLLCWRGRSWKRWAKHGDKDRCRDWSIGGAYSDGRGQTEGGRGTAAWSGFLREVLSREKPFNKRRTNKKGATTCKKHDHDAIRMITCKSILTKNKGKHLAILFISLQKAIKDVMNYHSTCWGDLPFLKKPTFFLYIKAWMGLLERYSTRGWQILSIKNGSKYFGLWGPYDPFCSYSALLLYSMKAATDNT